MSDITLSLLIPTVGGPVVAGLVGVFAARLNYDLPLKRLEIAKKRVELIESILSSKHVDLDAGQRQALAREISCTINLVLDTSTVLEEERVLSFSQLPLYQRIVSLPRPRSVGGRIATVIFYIYFLSAILYALLLPLIYQRNPGETGLVFAGLLFSLVIMLAGRAWALAAAKDAIVVAQAKCIIAAATPQETRGSLHEPDNEEAMLSEKRPLDVSVEVPESRDRERV